MEGFELFGEPPKEVEKQRFDLSKFDQVVVEVHKCIQQMIGHHLQTLRQELQQEAELKEFAPKISDIYRFLCVHEYKTLEKEANETANLLWEKMLGGMAHVVCCKESFLISQVSGCFSALIIQLSEPLRVNPDDLISNIQRVDRAHIMGAPPIITTVLNQQFELIRQKNQNKMRKATKCEKSHTIIPTTFSYEIGKEIQLNYPITKISNLSGKPITLAKFKEEFYTKQQPIIIQHSNQHWNAFDKWRNLEMWCQEFGHRLVPIEIGKLDPSQIYSESLPAWRESTLSIRDYIHKFIEDNAVKCMGAEAPESLSNDSIGYLAQHHLFQQLTALQEDFDIPVYCKVSQKEDNMDHVKTNAWFGTQDTVTSLHFDSYDNFLTQIFGYKYVRLYAPSESEGLYPIEDNSEQGGNSITKQNNISPVDIMNPDLAKYPKFKDASYVECILGPQDMLFIPHNWWHYVRSLSPSFSINFWF